MPFPKHLFAYWYYTRNKIIAVRLKGPYIQMRFETQQLVSTWHNWRCQFERLSGPSSIYYASLFSYFPPLLRSTKVNAVKDLLIVAIKASARPINRSSSVSLSSGPASMYPFSMSFFYFILFSIFLFRDFKFSFPFSISILSHYPSQTKFSSKHAIMLINTRGFNKKIVSICGSYFSRKHFVPHLFLWPVLTSTSFSQAAITVLVLAIKQMKLVLSKVAKRPKGDNFVFIFEAVYRNLLLKEVATETR